MKPLGSREGWVIVLGNLNEETTETDLMDYLVDFGNVMALHLNLDRQTGFCKGYALAQFRELKEARAAVEALHGSTYLNKTIQATFAFVEEETPRRRSHSRSKSPQ
jgi:RNA-binding protein 8A